MESVNVKGEFLENAIFGSDRLDVVIVRFHVIGLGVEVHVGYVLVFISKIDIAIAPKVICVKNRTGGNDVFESQFDDLAQVCVMQVVDGDGVMLEECPFDVVTKGFVEVATLVDI